MKIGIDLRPLQSHNKHRGIGRYISELVSSISKIDPKNKYIFYIFENLEDPLDEIDLSNNFNYQIEKVKFINIIHNEYMRILFNEFKPVKIKKGALDVFFQPDMQYGLPKYVKTIAIFYDLIPYYFWNIDRLNRQKGLRKAKVTLAGKIMRQRYLRTLRRFKNADSIIAISESSKKDLLNYFKAISPRSVNVVLLGFDKEYENIKKISKKQPNEIYGINSDFLLYVGGVDLRKNIVGLAKIFFKYKASNKNSIKLVMVGKEFENRKELIDLGWYDAIKDSKYKKDIIYTGYVDYNELNALYKNAKAFVFPSLYEGFGLPVLEAMAIGAPVVAFNNSSIPEVAGDAAVLCKNEKEFVEGIKKIVDDKKLTQSLIKKGYKQARKFSWEKTAKETLKVIEDLGNSRV